MTLWTDLGETWYAALESGGQTYGLARRTRTSAGTSYEYLDRETGAWRPDSGLAGAFTGEGGVTDATPVSPETAAELERALVGGSAG